MIKRIDDEKFYFPDVAGHFLGSLVCGVGFVKAVDPVGLSYKIEEYLGMFQLSGWSELSMLLSVLLCAAELTLGLLLLLRLWRRITAVAVTLFILVFTVLTYSIYTDPYGGINECGCFGEAVHLSNGATFAKNLILLVVSGFHLRNVFRQAGNVLISGSPGWLPGCWCWRSLCRFMLIFTCLLSTFYLIMWVRKSGQKMPFIFMIRVLMK